MIRSIEIQKFKRFKNPIKIKDLSSVNYLVGKNNSGKSSFLQAILLSTLYRNEDGSSFSDVRFPEKFARLKEYFSDEELSNPIKIVLGEENNKEIAIETQWRDNSVFKKKTGEGEIPRTLYIPCNVQISMTQDRASFNEVNDQIKQFGILPIDNINSWIYHQEKHTAGGTWGKKESKKFTTFKNSISKDFGVKVLLPEMDDDNQFYFKYLENKRERSLYLVGSGAQNVIYFVAAIVYLNNYALVLIDEPELHLHPAIQKKLGSIFRKLSEELNIQFVIATQSPFIISNLTKDDSVYILKKRNRKMITKEANFINTAVAMELGGEPSDVGAPENFILLEEASMERLLREINAKFFRKTIQFISCGGISRVADESEVIRNIIDHNLLLKCTPIYLSKYFIITDKLTGKIKEDKRIIDIKQKLQNRFIEMDFRTLEDAYPEKYLKDFIKTRKKIFDKTDGRNIVEKIKKWINEEPGNIGKRKDNLAKFIGNNITEKDFRKVFSKLLKIFE